MNGWECPRCRRCFAPSMVMCPCCPSVPVTVAPLPFGPLTPYPFACTHTIRVNGVCTACGNSTPVFYGGYGVGWVGSCADALRMGVPIMPDGFTTDTGLAPEN